MTYLLECFLHNEYHGELERTGSRGFVDEHLTPMFDIVLVDVQ
jgi:hypothetical protein